MNKAKLAAPTNSASGPEHHAFAVVMCSNDYISGTEVNSTDTSGSKTENSGYTRE